MLDLDDTIKLRAHHLLCLQGYQGYGYDENFKANLESLLYHFKTNPNVVVLKSADLVCSRCPNLKNRKCCLNLDKYDESLNKEKIDNSDKEIIKMDLNVIKKTDITENKSYKLDELYGKVNNSFKNVDDLEDICGNCKWIDACLWYQSKHKV